MSGLSPEATARLAEAFRERNMNRTAGGLAEIVAPVVAALVAEAVEAEAARDLAALRERIEEIPEAADHGPTHREYEDGWNACRTAVRALLDDGQADS